MLRVFLVDDEPPARARLRQLLSEAADVVVVGEAGDAIEARPAIASSRPDVVFLDVEMPETSGTALAASLPEPRPFVVFATAFDRYALDAFAVDATDYLVKPVTRARLAGTLDRVRERLSRRSELERELVAASATQALLLPRTLPLKDGYDAAAITVPARGVGGDFYLGQQLSPTRFVLALGDVAGKGMPAGLVASSLQARIETVARHAPASAPEIVADVNRSLHATSDSARFATLLYLDLNAAAHTLTVVNAGHLSLLVADARMRTSFVESTGPALGVLPAAQFDARTLTVAPGTLLIAYSDGVTEAIDADGQEFGERRLIDAVAADDDRTAHGMCRAVVDAVRQHAGMRGLVDDVTVMVVKRDANQSRALPLISR